MKEICRDFDAGGVEAAPDASGDRKRIRISKTPTEHNCEEILDRAIPFSLIEPIASSLQFRLPHKQPFMVIHHAGSPGFTIVPPCEPTKKRCAPGSHGERRAEQDDCIDAFAALLRPIGHRIQIEP